MDSNEKPIAKCRQLIEASLNWGDPVSWTNEDFEVLSDRIAEKTAVRLSVSTLKRIWGKVRYESSPTTATLNALARFAGFAGWREFLQKEAAPSGGQPEVGLQPGPVAGHIAGTLTVPVTAGDETRALRPVPSRRRFFMTALIVSTAVLVGLISLFGSRFHAGSPSRGHIADPDDSAAVVFSARKISDGLPNSVVFTYDASRLHPEKVIIQQSWDSTRREEVPVEGKEHTSLYYTPGYFMAKLIVDGTIRRECPVFIPSKGWKGIIDRKPLPVYLTADEVTGKDIMGISSAALRQKTGSDLFNNTWVEFADVREFEGIAADSFTFSATLRNTSTVEECLCRKIRVTVLGTQSAIIIPLADKGCISDLNMLTGERFISGKDNDLSAFGCDFRDFQRLTCTVKDHHFSVYLNDRLIFDREQHLTIGRIVGVRIAFEGAGEIREVSLRNADQPSGGLQQGGSPRSDSPQGGSSQNSSRRDGNLFPLK